MLHKELVWPYSLLQKLIVIAVLSGAILSAYNVGDLIAWAGIVYYSLCIAAALINYRRLLFMLWTAVGVHVVLISYSLWQWYNLGIEPCPYCWAAAGFLLVAAMACSRLPLVVFPVALMLLAGYAWPSLFTQKSPEQYIQQTNSIAAPSVPGPQSTNAAPPQVTNSTVTPEPAVENKTITEAPVIKKETPAKPGQAEKDKETQTAPTAKPILPASEETEASKTAPTTTPENSSPPEESKPKSG